MRITSHEFLSAVGRHRALCVCVSRSMPRMGEVVAPGPKKDKTPTRAMKKKKARFTGYGRGLSDEKGKIIRRGDGAKGRGRVAKKLKMGKVPIIAEARKKREVAV